jgi:hypothetical protein
LQGGRRSALRDDRYPATNRCEENFRAAPISENRKSRPKQFERLSFNFLSSWKRYVRKVLLEASP